MYLFLVVPLTVPGPWLMAVNASSGEYSWSDISTNGTGVGTGVTVHNGRLFAVYNIPANIDITMERFSRPAQVAFSGYCRGRLCGV